jgi:putative membrane protein
LRTDSKKTKSIFVDSLSKFIKGAVVGLVIILPGMSGGTMILLLGLYEDLMRDMAKLKLTRWVTFALGLAFGLILSGWIFAWVFTQYAFVILGVLLGCVLASVRTVLEDNRKPSVGRVVALVIGIAIGFVLSLKTGSVVDSTASPNMFYLMIGAALSSALMVLPGVPGGSVLYMMGIFDDIMNALANLDWKILIFYGTGAVLGMIGLSNLLNRMYMRHKPTLSWLFAGLIIGSARMLIPSEPGSWILFVALVAVGFATTWGYESYSKAKLKKAEIPEATISSQGEPREKEVAVEIIAEMDAEPDETVEPDQ